MFNFCDCSVDCNNDMRNVLVPSIWYCYNLECVVRVDPVKALMSNKSGWLCDCGDWIKCSNASHHVEVWLNYCVFCSKNRKFY